jgi:hypothetical protein
MTTPPVKYNAVCEAHSTYSWSDRHLMRADDLVCTACYRKLPRSMQNTLWRIKQGMVRDPGTKMQTIYDWLREHEATS